MAIELTPQPVIASGKLSVDDLVAVKAALAPLLTPTEPGLDKLSALSINVQPDGTATLHIRFK